MPAAPAAPPPAAAPKTAPATPPPAPAPELKPTQSINDAFSEIDTLIAAKPKPAPKTPKPGEKPAGQKPAEKPALKPAEKPAPKPGEKPEPKAEGTAPQPEAKPAVDPSKIAPELRTAYANEKKRTAELTQKLAEVESKASEYESLKKRFEDTQKRAQELETAIKFSDYEKSDEYKTKYFEPFLEAYQNARKKVSSMRTVERLDELGEQVVQERRQGTPQDFDAIMKIEDDGDAAEMADKLFGPQASVVMYQRERVMELNDARAKALNDFKKNSAERDQQTTDQRKAFHEKMVGTFKQALDEATTKYPQWFKAEDGDEEGAALLTKGMANADMVFNPPKGMQPEQLAVRHAALRNMAGAFPFVALKLHRYETKIAELEKELTEYRDSEPKGGQELPDAQAPATAYDEIDSIAGAGRR